eukprot:UN23799
MCSTDRPPESDDCACDVAALAPYYEDKSPGVCRAVNNSSSTNISANWMPVTNGSGRCESICTDIADCRGYSYYEGQRRCALWVDMTEADAEIVAATTASMQQFKWDVHPPSGDYVLGSWEVNHGSGHVTWKCYKKRFHGN